MKLYKLAAIPIIGLIAGLGLAACGSQGHADPARTKTVVEQKTRTVTKTIIQWKTRTVPGLTVTVTAAPAAAPVPTQVSALPTVSVSINPDTQPQVEPSQIGLSEDGNGDLTGITWSSWTAYSANDMGSD